MPIAHIIGLGKSGIAAARLLKRDGWEVTLSDRNTSEQLRQQQQMLEGEGITVKLSYSLELDSADLPQTIVVSPGVPWDAPLLVQARALGIETIGEIELAWRYLQSSPWVGITGTNGKTTTTALIAAIFQAAGFNAPACGNIGYAACEVALALPQPDWVIAEISSYQIESSPSVAPTIGVWTTFTPDHLSRHGTIQNYYDIKAHLLRQSQQQILNGDDAYLRKVGAQLISPEKTNTWWTSVRGKSNLLGNPSVGFYIEDGWVVEVLDAKPPARILPVATLRMVGEHNQQNLLMAVAAARLAGIDKAAIAQAIAKFPGVPHRLEHIVTWQKIDFINDSKATNYDAAQVGLSAVNAPAILIAGGEAKAGDDNGWLETIQAKAAAVLLIGSAASAFAQRLEQIGYSSYEIVETMDKAIARSAELAKQHSANVVLLSPACASFDQYQNFEQRGDHFRNLCHEFVDSYSSDKK
ncbi:UDP-N-acetylmuramoyl-L-alanine--D-glutamate ligase [Microcoleus sp. FACHB-831]|uniref:UDP-N-acetylmuramoyl-L-alanine--D-glutamate ligase n=1 Tax=Microcoleus sp. FACHB-831 TaxID=2692827 RepID=UPI001688887C|nr:UDP-N-acetylmuramoyl-L-alanine--D-glutamate ligase [Microcoleus sp. FACHB-831]MBD1922394.1 UDP-N-acetylmuramoyl-L-alanine--D-glutamate ligase [Microcoleus sp. FACHB-831]